MDNDTLFAGGLKYSVTIVSITSQEISSMEVRPELRLKRTTHFFKTAQRQKCISSDNFGNKSFFIDIVIITSYLLCHKLICFGLQSVILFTQILLSQILQHCLTSAKKLWVKHKNFFRALVGHCLRFEYSTYLCILFVCNVCILV